MENPKSFAAAKIVFVLLQKVSDILNSANELGSVSIDY